MRATLMKFFVPAAVLLAVPDLLAEVSTEMTLGSGYQGNLFNDSNSTGDTYASAGLQLKYYPSGATQLAAGASYNAFATYRDLSSLSGDASLTFIPTDELSPVMLALAGRASYKKFGALYDIYDQAGAALGADLGFRLMPWAHVQTSFTYFISSYANAEYGSSRSLNGSCGLNFTLPGSNALAVQAEFSRRLFDMPTLTGTTQGSSNGSVQTDSRAFDIAGFSLRLSRPLGTRTGLSLAAGHRILTAGDDYAVPGYTVDYLSPWADLWEGTSAAGALKHFFPKQITAELSVAYYDKSFVDALETTDIAGDSFATQSRQDRLTTCFLSLARPILYDVNHLLTPSISFGYRRNISSLDYFSYEDLFTSFTLNLAF